jgi:hypothetical protein
MNLEDSKMVFVAVGLVGVLLFSSPTLALVVHFPGSEKFSELWLLGPGHMAEDYPSNVGENVNYMVYLGVGNHMGSSVYYIVMVKLRNETELLPNSTAGTESPLPPLYEDRLFVQDGGIWESRLVFSFSGISFGENQSRIESLTINGVELSVEKVASWDTDRSGYYCELFVELWIYNPNSDVFVFHNRFVGLWLNMTGPS